MFSISNFLRPKRNAMANDLGYNDCWLGLAKSNPFPINTIEWKEYEWGWNQAEVDVDEHYNAPSHYPSNEYEDWA